MEILVIAEECTVAHTGLALGELLALAPCGVLRDAAAFLLSEAGHNRDKEFSACVERSDVLFFKVNLYTVFLEFSDVLQRIHSVPRKTADGLCNDRLRICIFIHKEPPQNGISSASNTGGSSSKSFFINASMTYRMFLSIFGCLIFSLTVVYKPSIRREIVASPLLSQRN